ncbi:hypothetical protein [Burkholderia vietnamiensis]|uniref:hypothetical protein n=1 Tax=Burkholderia vietnamiensis TaxID=60552 RepID=UPI00352EE36B
MESTADTLELNQDGSIELGAGDDANADGNAHASTAADGAQSATHENGGEGAPGEGGEGDEFEFQFGDEAPPASEGQEHDASAPQWVKELRKEHTASQRRIRELEAQLQQNNPQQAPAVPTLGPKPTLEQFDYDEGKFDEALGKWYADKAKVDAARVEQENVAAARQRSIDERLNGYRTEATGLRVKDFQVVESDVVAALSVEQQGILLAGADKPATLVYALGRYPHKLRTLAEIKDPVRFAFAAGKLEGTLKVATRTANSKPAPEGRVSSSSGAPSGGGEKKLEQLRAEAEKTGDYTKVHAYKRQLKQAQARK